MEEESKAEEVVEPKKEEEAPVVVEEESKTEEVVEPKKVEEEVKTEETPAVVEEEKKPEAEEENPTEVAAEEAAAAPVGVAVEKADE